MLASEKEGSGWKGVVLSKGLRRMDAINGSWSALAQRFSMLAIIASHETLSPPRENLMAVYVMHRLPNVMRTSSR